MLGKLINSKSLQINQCNSIIRQAQLRPIVVHKSFAMLLQEFQKKTSKSSGPLRILFCRFSFCNLQLFQFLRGHSKSRPPGEFPYQPLKTLNHELVQPLKCCRTHIFLQNFVLIQPRTSPPNIFKI